MENKLTDQCFVKHNFLTNDECDFLIDYYKKNVDRRGLENSLDVFERKQKVSSFEVVEILSQTNQFDFIKKKVTEGLLEYAKYLEDIGLYHTGFLDWFQFSHKYRILRYEPGNEIHPHLDHDTYNYGSLTLNLNEDYEGGDFTFFNKKFTPKLKKGTLMIFPADIFWTHQVIPVTKGTRYSMNTFIKSDPDPVIHQIKRYNLQNLLKDYMKFTDSKDMLGPYFPNRFKNVRGY